MGCLKGTRPMSSTMCFIALENKPVKAGQYNLQLNTPRAWNNGNVYPNMACIFFCIFHTVDPFELSICSNNSFSPNEKTGTKDAFCLIARRMNPKRRFSVKSAVPGLAYNDSAAPPITMTIERPGPDERIRSHEERDTEAIPIAKIKSRYNGKRKLLQHGNVR